MKSYSLTHLADRTLLQALAALVSQDRTTTAALLAHLAEVDERRLYLRAAYPSMYLYCVRELRMSEDTAFKRIRAARSARQFPAIFPSLADGRLNLSGVLLLAPRLTTETADDLLTSAAHKPHAEIERMLAERFPQPDMPTFVQALSPAAPTDGLAAGSGGSSAAPLAPSEFRQLATWPVATIVETATRRLAPSECRQLAPEPVGPSSRALEPATMASMVSRAKITALSPGRYALQVTVDQETHDLLRYAQALLGHALPSGEVATVLKRALGSLVRDLEQQKFAKSARSRPRHGAVKGRYVPADIRRAVWQRDGGQCTFVSEHGRRCESTTRLEFDHIDPVVRGGQTSADRMRLRCRAHNQYAAECTFGVGFMRGKRQGARCRVAQAQAREQAQTKARTQAAAGSASQRDVIPWLRQLGFSAEEARRGAALCAHIPDAPLEQRVRVALRGLAPNCARRAAPVTSGPA